jgi:hypothetical protein
MDLTKEAQSNGLECGQFLDLKNPSGACPRQKNTLRKKSACPRQKINEKKAIKLLETFEYKPKKYAERVNHIFEVLGLSLFECYDMTEKLYKEVKKIATEINNFLNEGEFR